MNKGVQLLIVDDEADIANFIQDIFLDRSYTAETAQNGEEAMAFLEKSSTDILITDIRMPGMDGLELMKRTKELHPNVSCMIMTGHGDMDSAVQAVKLGAVDFFTKPIDITEFEKAEDNEISRLLMEKKVRQQQQEIALFNKKLAKEISKNQAILHAAGQGILGLDDEGEVTFINPVAMEILGWNRNELIACKFQDLVAHGDEGDTTSLPVPPNNKCKAACQTVFKRKDGTLCPVEYVNSSIVEEGNEGSVLVFEDITERQMQQKNLARAKVAAEQADRAKSQFLANMSHEIRTPLNGILGITEILLANKLDHRQKQLCEAMLRSGRILLQLVNDVLDVSKIESGHLELDAENFDLEKVIEDSLEIVSESANKKELGLAYRIETGLSRHLIGDSHRLQQILLNLLANAVKFTTQGEITVRVRKVENSPEKDMLHFEVQDTGIGISLEAQEHIFDSFTQADLSTTKTFGGSGLGLTIVQHLAAMMGGDIGVSSDPGKGARFWFTASLPPQGSQAPPLSLQREPLPGLRVLIIDPHPLSCRFLGEQLQEWQVTSRGTGDVSEGLRLLAEADRRKQPYNLVLFDALAGSNNAKTVASAIAESGEETKTSFVLITPLRNKNRTEGGLGRLVDTENELGKPLSMASLYDKLRLAYAPETERPVTIEQNNRKYDAAFCCSGTRILLVDDNYTNQLVVSEMLSLAGCRPDVAANGREAVAMLKEGGYDLVFMDCQMPDMDGFEATRHIRQLERERGVARRTPIIAMTAKALHGDKKNCLAAGMDDYLRKPFSRDELQQMLHIWLPDKPVSQQTCPEQDGEYLGPKADQQEPSCSVDMQILERLRSLQEKSGTNILEELYLYFQNDTPKTIDFLKQAINSRDWKSMQAEAHRFKSSCANLGAVGMVALCHRLQTIENPERKQALKLLWNLEREYAVVAKILAQETK